MKQKQFRQGDVWIEEIKRIPKKAIKKENSVLAYGEATGHHHSVDVPVMELNDELFFKGPATLTHQEHSIIKIPTGTYRTFIQQEYSPEKIRKVVD